MSCSGIYILDSKGKALISRNYRGDVETADVDKFMTLVMEKEEEGITSPIIGNDGTEVRRAPPGPITNTLLRPTHPPPTPLVGGRGRG